MSETMRAIGYRRSLPITDPASLLDLTLPIPVPGPHDLLVRVEAVAVNPVDVEVRASSDPGGSPAITAWEVLFDRLRLTPASDGTLLALAAAGGVGSILTQLARRLTAVTVIGTASRPESRQWVLDQGAHQVINHHDGYGSLADSVDYVFSPVSGGMIETYASILRPYGSVVAIDEPAGLDLLPLKDKSIAWHWEFMFTRGRHDPSSAAQHDILVQVAGLVDKGILHTTETKRFDGITAANMRAAHELQESGSTIGKTVLVGF